MKKKCLVTGGAGFIGSHVVDLLIKEGHEVTVVDDLSTGKEENLNKKAKFIMGDIQNNRVMVSLCKGIDWVFHLAAWARVPRSIKDPIGTNNVNVGGTLSVLEACRRAKVKRLVYSSSSSVYGDQETYLMTEGLSKKPKSPYALQKWIGELYCEMFADLFEMDIVGLRYFNAYGPRQLTEGAYTLVIGKFLKQKAEGEPMTIYGDGKQTRAYTYVSEVARANLLAAKAKLSNYNVVNIGTSKETSVNEIAELIEGKTKHIIPNPRGKFEERRKAADYSKAEKLIGWKPTINIKEGINGLKHTDS